MTSTSGEVAGYAIGLTDRADQAMYLVKRTR
jgi:hypothetical protein